MGLLRNLVIWLAPIGVLAILFKEAPVWVGWSLIVLGLSIFWMASDRPPPAFGFRVGSLFTDPEELDIVGPSGLAQVRVRVTAYPVHQVASWLRNTRTAECLGSPSNGSTDTSTVENWLRSSPAGIGSFTPTGHTGRYPWPRVLRSWRPSATPS